MFVIAHHDRVVLASDRRGAGQRPEGAALEHVEPRLGHGQVEPAIDERAAVEARRRSEHLEGVLGPAEHQLLALEHHAVAGGEDAPDVGELPRVGRQPIDHRHVAHRALSIGFEVAEIADAAGVDAAGAVDGQRPHDIELRRFDQPPRGAVELEDARRTPDVDHASRVLDDGPVLAGAAQLDRRVLADERAAFFRVPARHAVRCRCRHHRRWRRRLRGWGPGRDQEKADEGSERGANHESAGIAATRDSTSTITAAQGRGLWPSGQVRCPSVPHRRARGRRPGPVTRGARAASARSRRA